MGVYVYTLRKATKKISGLEVAQYAFAYKESWGRDLTRVEAAKIAAGDRAADAVITPYFVVCSDFDWIEENSGENDFLVYKADGNLRRSLPGNFSDNQMPKGKPVGYLVREGRKIVMRYF